MKHFFARRCLLCVAFIKGPIFGWFIEIVTSKIFNAPDLFQHLPVSGSRKMMENVFGMFHR